MYSSPTRAFVNYIHHVTWFLSKSQPLNQNGLCGYFEEVFKNVLLILAYNNTLLSTSREAFRQQFHTRKDEYDQGTECNYTFRNVVDVHLYS